MNRAVIVPSTVAANAFTSIVEERSSGALPLMDAIDAWWRPAAFLLALVLLWWLVTAAGWVKPYLVPTPWSVVVEFGKDAGLLAHHSGITLLETVVGFVVAAVVGLVCAVAIVYSRGVERTLYPLLLAAQVVPKIAIAPLFVVWLGFGIAPKILVAVLIAFFPVVISGVAGLRAVDPELLDLAATMGAKPWDSFAKIRFPGAMPHIFAGLKVAVTLAVVGAVVGEFVGANSGLGYIVMSSNGNLNTPQLFAALICMSAIGIVLFVLLEIAERFAVPWRTAREERDILIMS
jgi:NitT/TauT family transport system permease protein